jgi:hypothetical protein
MKWLTFILLTFPVAVFAAPSAVIHIEKQKIRGKVRGPQLVFVEPKTADKEVLSALFERVLQVTESELLDAKEKGAVKK